MLTALKLLGYRFPLSPIGHAVWRYHRYTLKYRDVEEPLFGRGIDVSRESIRTWCINFSGEFAQQLLTGTKCMWGWGRPLALAGHRRTRSGA